MNVGITGHTSGIGQYISRNLLRDDVWAFGRGKPLNSRRHTHVDFENYANIETKELPIFDAFIHCAGYNNRVSSQWASSEATKHLNINVLGPMNLNEELRSKGKLRQGCNIIFFGSYSGMHPTVHHTAYSMSKAALHSYVKTFAQKYSLEYNTNILLPGRVNTPGNPEREVSGNNKFKQPEDIIDWVRFLIKQTDTGPNGQIFDLGRE